MRGAENNGSSCLTVMNDKKLTHSGRVMAKNKSAAFTIVQGSFPGLGIRFPALCSPHRAGMLFPRYFIYRVEETNPMGQPICHMGCFGLIATFGISVSVEQHTGTMGTAQGGESDTQTRERTLFNRINGRLVSLLSIRINEFLDRLLIPVFPLSAYP